jgi:hemerythrin-like domain-containing protein
MNPTEQLKKEHKAIKLMLNILAKICEKADPSPEHLDRILEFIKVFVDQCHHGKEEDPLFPTMEEAGTPRERGPIGVMLTEHNMGRDLIKNMNEAVVKYKAGDDKAVSKIVEHARGYITLLTEHIEKEDSVLFPMADRNLSEENQKKLLEEFEKLEHDKIGVGKHEELHDLLHYLKEVYLH